MNTELLPLLKHGFVGQRMIVIPKKILSGVKQNPLTSTLYFTDIGFFPNAANHSVKRKNGSKQYILFYCYKGQGTIETDTLTINLKANTFYIISPGVAHHYYSHPKNPWYAARQYNDAIACWEKSVNLNDTFPTVHRNLSLAYYNKLKNPDTALASLEKAFALDSTDARILMELDQLYKRFNKELVYRLAFLEKH